jgi:hypothetical protein
MIVLPISTGHPLVLSNVRPPEAMIGSAAPVFGAVGDGYPRS